MKLRHLLLLLYALSLANANVFEKYIQLKRSLKQPTLPVHQAIPQPPTRLDPPTAKSEAEMRAAMLAKPSNTTAKHKHTKYASGHTFIPSVHTNTRRAPNSTKPSSTAHHLPKTVKPPTHHVPREDLLDAVVGQPGRDHETNVPRAPKNPWAGSKAVPVVVVGVLIWACAILANKTGARRKARVLKKRLTHPRLVA